MIRCIASFFFLFFSIVLYAFEYDLYDNQDVDGSYLTESNESPFVSVGVGAVMDSSDAIIMQPGSIVDHGDSEELGSIAWALVNYSAVILLPGEYSIADRSTIEIGVGCSLIGSGKYNTIISKTGFSVVSAVSMPSGTASISNLCINFQRNGVYYQGQAALKVLGRQSAVSNVRINATGIGANGIYLASGGGWLNNVEVVTEGIGISMAFSGMWYASGCNIVLVGHNVGVDHIGIRANIVNGRMHWFGGRIGTGYGYDEIVGDTDKTFCSIYVPKSAAATGRLTFWNLNSFVRINDGANDPALASIYRDDSGNCWTRFFGCFGQAEIPSGVAAWQGQAIINNKGGKVETYSCRFSGYNGQVMGAPQMGVRKITEDTTLKKFESGWILIDASSNSVSLSLPWASTNMAGDSIFIKCIDASNPVTINCRDNTINGLTSNVSMLEGDVVKMFFDGTGFQTESPLK